jgi:alcohol dehydrogenase, propanol-preferring
MKAMLLKTLTDLRKNVQPLILEDVPIPRPGDDGVLIKISTCGVCHTELDEIEGRTPPPSLPVIPGHQVVGRVAGTGQNVTRLKTGDRVGVAWIFSSCGKCSHCRSGNENLCAEFRATGRDVNGGYAEYMTVKEKFAHPIPAIFSDEEAAPLLCAGAIGYRSLRLTGLLDTEVGGRKSEVGGLRSEDITLGLAGFGASAHLVMKMVKYRLPGMKVFVFARNEPEREFARELGASWAGDFTDECPEKLDAVIDTTPVWKPVVEALRNLKPGGRLVINAIRKENIDREYLLNLDYPLHLWMEKEIRSVANVALNDVREFLDLAAAIPIRPEIQMYALEDANLALSELKQGKIRGAKVLKII